MQHERLQFRYNIWFDARHHDCHVVFHRIQWKLVSDHGMATTERRERYWSSVKSIPPSPAEECLRGYRSQRVQSFMNQSFYVEFISSRSPAMSCQMLPTFQNTTTHGNHQSSMYFVSRSGSGNKSIDCIICNHTTACKE